MSVLLYRASNGIRLSKPTVAIAFIGRRNSKLAYTITFAITTTSASSTGCKGSARWGIG